MSEASWSDYQVPTLAGMLGDDFSTAHRHVAMWDTAHGMLSDTASGLARAVETLSEAWPPEHSEASAAFLDVVEGLVRSIRDTAAAAATNAYAFERSVVSLDRARERVMDLHVAWRVSQMRSPAEPAWQEPLNAEAHEALAQADEVAFETARTLIVPMRYEPPYPGPDRGDWHWIGPDISAPASPAGSTSDGGHEDRELSATLGSTDRYSGGPVSNLPGTTIGSIGIGYRSGFNDVATGGVASGSGLIAGRYLPAMRATTQRTVGRVSTSASSGGSDIAAALSGEGASPSPGSPLYPPMAAGAISQAGQRPKRRTAERAQWPVPHGLSEILARIDAPDVHEPGLGVIGIDK